MESRVLSWEHSAELAISSLYTDTCITWSKGAVGLGLGTRQQSGKIRLVRDEVHKCLGVLTFCGREGEGSPVQELQGAVKEAALTWH